MPINDTVQLSVIGTVGSINHVHTMHFRYNDVLSSDADLAAEFNTNLITAYRAMFGTADTPAITVRVQQVCGAVPLRAAAEVAPAVAAGTRVLTGIGEPLPTWLAQVVSVRTALAGRSRRGRMFLGGLYEWDVFQNIMTGALTPDSRSELAATYVGALQARYFAAAHPTNRYQLVVHSSKLASVPGTQCQDSSTPVTAFVLRANVGSMRSRYPGSGT